MFNLYARLMSEAAAAGRRRRWSKTFTDGLERLAAWWDHFATVEVSDVRRVHGGEAACRPPSAWPTRWLAGTSAARPPPTWPSGAGTSTGFRSPKAFALVVDTLLRKADYRAALALL